MAELFDLTAKAALAELAELEPEHAEELADAKKADIVAALALAKIKASK